MCIRDRCMIDPFDATRYEAPHMAVLGRTGAGKTMTLSCLALRLREQGVRVVIIAPKKGFEYRAACEAVGGKYIKLSPSSRDCINFMEDVYKRQAVTLRSISTGTWNEELKYTIYYKTNLVSEERVLAERLSTGTNNTIDCSASALKLKAGEVITEIRLDFEMCIRDRKRDCHFHRTSQRRIDIS